MRPWALVELGHLNDAIDRGGEVLAEEYIARIRYLLGLYHREVYGDTLSRYTLAAWLPGALRVRR